MSALCYPDSVAMHAAFLAERLRARDVPGASRLEGSAYVLHRGEGAFVILFRYGVVVSVGMNAAEREAAFSMLKEYAVQPFGAPAYDEIVVGIDEASGDAVTNVGVTVRNADMDRLFVVADVLAKSVVLDYYEVTIGAVFEAIEPLAARLQRTGRPGPGIRQLLRHVGHCLLIQHRTLWQVEIEDRPELVWEHPELERFHIRIADEYELRERHQALSRKLQLVDRTAETIVGLVQQTRSLRVEWYIVMLILVEIALTLYELSP